MFFCSSQGQTSKYDRLAQRVAASDDKIAPFSTDNYQKLLSKHPQRAKFAAPNSEKLDSFFVTDFDLYKAIM